jgi:hypothetical protein
MGTFSRNEIFTKNSPISSIFDQILQFEHTFQSIFHALHESDSIKLKIFFSTILDHIWYGLWGWFRGQKVKKNLFQIQTSTLSSKYYFHVTGWLKFQKQF